MKDGTFVPVSWMCKRQTGVSNSSTESEIISLDDGLRMDVLPALDLWDIMIEVLRSTNNNVQPKHTSIQETDATLHSKTEARKVARRQKVDQLSDAGYVPTNTHSSHSESQLYIFEDSEAVIKMIIKRRSPTVTHVQNPQVALGWVFHGFESRFWRHDGRMQNSSRSEALLYIFEDNEAVIKMIIKGRSPTLRHVSRTHRVALDWLFDRINLEHQIQIKHVNTKNQIADMLTKGSFSRDE